MTPEAIREFLVSLGFQIDENGLRRFVKGTEGATKVVAGLGVAIVTTAAAIVASVNKISSEFEDLYYASQRTRASVANIKATEYAFTQLGGTGAQALNVLEGIASFMRSNPAGESFIRSLGVETRKTNGDLKDTSDIMHGLAASFRRMPFYRAKITASLLGIDEQSLIVLLRDRGKQEDQYRKMLAHAGLNPDAMAKTAHEFRVRMREILAQYSIVGTVLASKLLPVANNMLTSMSKFGDNILKWLSSPEAANLGNAIGHLGSGIWSLVQRVEDFGGRILKFLNLNSMERLSQVINSVAGTLDAVNDLLTGDVHGLKEHAKQAGKDTFNYVVDTFQKWGADFSKDAGSNKGDVSRAQALDFFQKHGWTKEQAAGIVANLSWESGLKAHGKPGDGGKALGVAQWHADRQAEFAKRYGHDISKSTIGEQLDFVNYELTKGAERHAGALLKASKDAYHAAGVVTKFYERPKDVTGNMVLRGNLANQIIDQATQAAAAHARRTGANQRHPAPAAHRTDRKGHGRAAPQQTPAQTERLKNGGFDPHVLSGSGQAAKPAASVTIQQKTDIHVHGSDAKQAAATVLDGQHRVNGDLVRQFKSAVT